MTGSTFGAAQSKDRKRSLLNSSIRLHPPTQRDHARRVFVGMVYNFTPFLLSCGRTMQRGIVNAAIGNRRSLLDQDIPYRVRQQFGITAVHNRRAQQHIVLLRSVLRSIAST